MLESIYAIPLSTGAQKFSIRLGNNALQKEVDGLSICLTVTAIRCWPVCRFVADMICWKNMHILDSGN